MKKGHSYPSKFGFSGSRGKVPVAGYMRKAPTRPRVPSADVPPVGPPGLPRTPR